MEAHHAWGVSDRHGDHPQPALKRRVHVAGRFNRPAGVSAFGRLTPWLLRNAFAGQRLPILWHLIVASTLVLAYTVQTAVVVVLPNDQIAARDYYIAQGSDATCYWIYLERVVDGRWYLHGMFG